MVLLNKYYHTDLEQNIQCQIAYFGKATARRKEAGQNNGFLLLNSNIIRQAIIAGKRKIIQ